MSIPLDDNYFDDFDFENAEVIKHPLVEKMQHNAMQSSIDLQELPIDDDIVEWLQQQDESTQRHINEVIRHFMAVKMV